MSTSKKFKTGLLLILFTAIFLIAGLVVFDVLFSKPQLMKGVIVDKIFVPNKNSVGPNVLPYSRYKTYDYTIQAEKEEQWIAFVRIDDGNVLKVNCHTHHYDTKQIGDTLHFKEYTGELLHIDYFSHNEEDVELEKD